MKYSGGIIVPQGKLDEKYISEQLTRVNSSRSSEDTVLWSIFGAFIASNAILINILFSNNVSNYTQIIKVIGIVISLSWGVIQYKALFHIKRLELIQEIIEKELKFEEKYRLSGYENSNLRYLKKQLDVFENRININAYIKNNEIIIKSISNIRSELNKLEKTKNRKSIISIVFSARKVMSLLCFLTISFWIIQICTF